MGKPLTTVKHWFNVLGVTRDRKTAQRLRREKERASVSHQESV
jgi:hypothetical protein